jgi:hypothetical protein
MEAEAVSADKTIGSNSSGMVKSVTETVALITGIAGLSVAIFWYAGRRFASGYFSAMKIPLYQLEFPIWEYAEVSWFALIGFPLIIIFGINLLHLGVSLASRALGRVFGERKPKRPLRVEAKPKKSSSWTLNPKERSLWSIAKLAFDIGFAIVAAISLGSLIYWFGHYVGQGTVLNEYTQVEIASTTPLNLGASQIITSTTGQGIATLHIYEELRLLTSNNGNFYLFKEIDSADCEPLEVFIVKSDSVQAIFSSSPSIANRCPSRRTWLSIFF